MGVGVGGGALTCHMYPMCVWEFACCVCSTNDPPNSFCLSSVGFSVSFISDFGNNSSVRTGKRGEHGEEEVISPTILNLSPNL